ncbi:MAG TPA: polysaccharide deacetylase family protein [Clostridia bacterium]|nr:polysaccharide deacetylase family protein [Clostridia bacterium]
MDKYLIINADDFGMCRAANLATFDLLKCGGITSATVMVPCGWAPEACKFAQENPEFGIGVHLTLTSEWSKYRWSPVAAENTASLRDEDGYMHHESDQVEENVDIDEVEGELRAQIERAKKLGLAPSHLDNHMGSLYGIETGRFELLKLTFDIASEYNLPFRFPSRYTPEQIALFGPKVDADQLRTVVSEFNAYAAAKNVAIPDYLITHDWSGPQSDSYENFRDYMFEHFKTFPPGVTETFIHPALESDELKGTSGVWFRRVWEHRLFADPATRQYLEELGIEYINYRDLAKMKL